MPKLRILLVDDHYAVRHGLRAILETQPGLEVCGEVADGVEAISKAIELQPDVVLVDLNLPIISGIEVMRQIRQTAPEMKLLAFTIHDSREMVRQAVKAGASGYVLKSDSEEQLFAAIDAVCQGKRFFSPGLPPDFISELARGPNQPPGRPGSK